MDIHFEICKVYLRVVVMPSMFMKLWFCVWEKGVRLLSLTIVGGSCFCMLPVNCLCSVLYYYIVTISFSWSLSWTRAVPCTWSRDGVSCWIFSCAGSLFCLKSLHLASSWQQVGHTTCSLLLSYVRERGNANTLAACSVSSCLCCFVPVNQVCVGPFREHGTHCNDREQVHEPDFLSSRLVENIDFALFARFGRHFLSLSASRAFN